MEYGQYKAQKIVSMFGKVERQCANKCADTVSAHGVAISCVDITLDLRRYHHRYFYENAMQSKEEPMVGSTQLKVLDDISWPP
jgi:hypothetical protein